jgi:hypothetical protein
MATTPAVVLFEFLLHRSVPSLRVVGSIVVLLTGVAMCSVLDLGVRGPAGAGLLLLRRRRRRRRRWLWHRTQHPTNAGDQPARPR